MEDTAPNHGVGEMHKRRITIEGNRYLIFYTFDGSEEVTAESSGEDLQRQTGEVKPEATEERRV